MKVICFETGKEYTFSLCTYDENHSEFETGYTEDSFDDCDPFSEGFCPCVGRYYGRHVYMARQKDIDFVADYFRTEADAWNEGRKGAFGDPSRLDDMTYYNGEPCHLGSSYLPLSEDEYRPKLDENGCPYEQYIFSADVDDPEDLDEDDLAEIRETFLFEEAKHSH